MKSIIIKSALFLALVAGTASCVNGDDYAAPANTCVDPQLTANVTLAQLFAQATTTPVQYTQNDIVEGYVSSSDESGNIYKFIYIQTLNTSGIPVGAAIPINLNSTYGEGFYPGRKIYIKLQNLYIAKVDGGLSIGELYQSTPSATPEIGRISELTFKDHLFPSCDEVEESALVSYVTYTQGFSNTYLNTLVELTDVQFADSSVGRTYYDVDSGGGATNHIPVSTSTNTSNEDNVVRFSSYANFAGLRVPSGSGSIRGVMTKYGSAFQLMPRYVYDQTSDNLYLSDVKLTGPRVDAFPPIGGTAIVYNQTLNETFESFSSTSGSQYLGSVFPGYINDAFVGSRYWDVKTFSSNKYIQMSAFNSNDANQVYFIVPVQMTPGYKFSFQSKDGYNDGQALRVYYSTNYVPGGNVGDATLVDITNSFAIASGSTSGYATNFTNSGDYVIPSNLSGNGFFIFEYTGQDDTGVTTTMQIDNVKLVP